MALTTEASPDTRRTTKRGTPCAGNWNKKWVRRVQRRETELGRRICGARTADGTPCLLPSEHSSGRCPRHGGFDNTGAPAGNRNAATHGLYSRRIADCGIESELELEEYLAVTDAVEQRTNPHGDNPLGRQLAHKIALTSVMVDRAFKAALATPVTETVEHTGEHYRMTTTKVSAPLTACKLLLSELRQWLRDLERTYPPSPGIGGPPMQPAPLDPASRGIGFQPMRQNGVDKPLGETPHPSPTPHGQNAPTSTTSTPPETIPQNSGAGFQPAGLHHDTNRINDTNDRKHTDTDEIYDDDLADDNCDDAENDYGQEWQQLTNDIADHEKRWEKQNRPLKNTNAPSRGIGGPPMQPAPPDPASRGIGFQPMRANGKGDTSIETRRASSHPTPHPTPMISASPSHDLDKLRAKFIGTLKAMEADRSKPDPGPAP